MNKRIFKRCLCGVLTAAMAATALVGFTGCGESGAGLTVMIYGQTHEMEIYEQMRQSFEEENPDIGTVEIQQSQQDGYATQVTSALAAGTMADVFYIEPANVARYAEQGQILALDEHFDEAQQEAINDIWPDAVNAFRYDSSHQADRNRCSVRSASRLLRVYVCVQQEPVRRQECCLS